MQTVPAISIPPTPLRKIRRYHVEEKTRASPALSGASSNHQWFVEKPPVNGRWLLFFALSIIGTEKGKSVERAQRKKIVNAQLLSFLQEFLGNLRELLANLAGQPVMKTACLNASDIRHNHRSRSGHSHNEPYHDEEKEAGQGNQLQDQRVTGRKVPYCAECHQKHHGRNSGHDHQSNINGAVQDLAGTAVCALRQMRLIVAAHLRGQA